MEIDGIKLDRTRLIYRSRLSHKRVVRFNILETHDLALWGIVLKVQARGGLVSGLFESFQLRRHMFLFLNRQNGDVFYIPEGVPLKDLKVKNVPFIEDKIHVGIKGEIE